MALLLEADTVAGAGSSVEWQARQLGDYILGRQLGSGGMGVVYEAQQVSLRRAVAIKLIRDSQVASPMLLRRFMVEAEAAARLSHPNIVAVHEIGESDGQPYYSMELIEGESLWAKIAKGEFVLEQNEGSKSNGRNLQVSIARLMAKMARALHHAHQRGVLHRDFKPSNILIDSDGEPHLTDFGLAKILHQTSEQSPRSSLTATGEITGSAGYMSPEQAAGAETTSASDTYGLGAVLYEQLTQQPPFRGHTLLETLKLIQEQPPKRPRAINRFIERDLETICLKCLEKDPHYRYASAEALAEDLESWIDRKPIKARRVNPVRRATQWIKRNPVGTAFIAILCLGLSAALILLNMVSKQKDEIDSRQAMLFGETIDRMLRTWGDPNTYDLTIESKYLGILDNRSPNYETKGRQVSLGLSIQGDPISFAQWRAKLIGHLEKAMSKSLGEPVLLDLKLFKRSGHDAEMLAQGQADFMVVDPVMYLEAKKSNPGIALIARENKGANGVIVTTAKSGVTQLQQLAGKSMAFPEWYDAVAVWAKARLFDAGVLAKDLAFVTNFVNQPDFAGGNRRGVSTRETIVGVLNGRFDAGVTTARRFELEKHRGLVKKLDSFPGTPSVFAARQGLATSVVTAFRTALLNAPTELSPSPKETFEWEGFFPGAVGIDDSYFDAFRVALRKAARFDGNPDPFAPAQHAPAPAP